MLTVFNNLGYSVEWRYSMQLTMEEVIKTSSFLLSLETHTNMKSLDSKYENEDIVF